MGSGSCPFVAHLGTENRWVALITCRHGNKTAQVEGSMDPSRSPTFPEVRCGFALEGRRLGSVEATAMNWWDSRDAPDQNVYGSKMVNTKPGKTAGSSLGFHLPGFHLRILEQPNAKSPLETGVSSKGSLFRTMACRLRVVCLYFLLRLSVFVVGPCCDFVAHIDRLWEASAKRYLGVGVSDHRDSQLLVPVALGPYPHPWSFQIWTTVCAIWLQSEHGKTRQMPGLPPWIIMDLLRQSRNAGLLVLHGARAIWQVRLPALENLIG